MSDLIKDVLLTENEMLVSLAEKEMLIAKQNAIIAELNLAIEEFREENKVLKRALELACEDLSLYEDFTTAEFKVKCYIKQAKEMLK